MIPRVLLCWGLSLIPSIALAVDNVEEEIPIWWFIIWPFAFILFFSLIWCGAIYITSLLSGWATLAKQYATAMSRPSNSATTSGVFRYFGNYNGVLYLGSTKSGIHLSVMKIFTIGHPDLFIPWEKIKNEKEFTWFFMKYFSFKVDGISIRIRSKQWHRALEQHPRFEE